MNGCCPLEDVKGCCPVGDENGLCPVGGVNGCCPVEDMNGLDPVGGCGGSLFPEPLGASTARLLPLDIASMNKSRSICALG
jgi:hypothetical protein